MKNTNKNTAVLLLHCPDKQGIIAAVTEFININKGNIIYLDQHVDKAEKIFFMRVEWELDNFLIPTDKINEYFQTLLANKYEMEFQIRKPRPPGFAGRRDGPGPGSQRHRRYRALAGGGHGLSVCPQGCGKLHMRKP